MTKYFNVLDVDIQTKRGYLSKYNTHIKPLLGATQLTRLDVETLDTLYSELRRCRIHCRARKKDIEHRTTRPHQCDEHEGNRCPSNNPAGCRRCRRMCKPHVCKGLTDSTVPLATRSTTPQIPSAMDEDLQPYERIAADLRGAIDSGILSLGDPLPSEKALATRHGVAASTAHRAVALLVSAGLVTSSRGKRATVATGGEPEVASVTELRLSNSPKRSIVGTLRPVFGRWFVCGVPLTGELPADLFVVGEDDDSACAGLPAVVEKEHRPPELTKKRRPSYAWTDPRADPSPRVEEVPFASQDSSQG